jgi:hypothetical protein
MTTVYEIPTTNQAQTFGISLASGSYQMTLRYNQYLAAWVLDIATAASVAIVSGVPLITGADLLGQFRHLGFTGSLIVQTDDATDTVPTYVTLGTTGHLYYLAP